ncbi:EpsG family protein [Epilithonimonas sp.]|uniref:EpsG family protein n=1 Tax=Epilithonimonas sp. TaxID=2894511 RepID=UPI002FDD4730
MLPYLLIFFISIFCTFLAEKTVDKNKILFFFFSAIAVLAPSLLAGFRDSGVGTDTKIYVDRVWGVFKHVNDWNQFYKYYTRDAFSDIEFVYLLLNFIGSRFGEKVNIIYFITSFVITLLVYLSAFENRKKSSMWLVMFIFLFGYYNQSLNLVRQTIALGIGLYGFKYLEDRKWIKVILLLILLKYTHNTGIFYIGFAGAYLLSVLKYKAKYITLIITLFCSIFIFIYFDFLIGFLVLSGILPSKFLFYLSGDTIDYTSLFIFHFIISIILMTIYVFKINSLEKDSLLSFAFINLLGSILILTSLVSVWSFRVAFYFLFISECLFLPRALYLMRNKRLEYIIMMITIIFLYLFFWNKVYIINNDNDTYPYKSEIIDNF